jgi:hypothetical protein
MNAACSHGCDIVIFDENPAVSKLLSIHATVFAGRVFLNVLLGQNKMTAEKNESDCRQTQSQLFHWNTPLWFYF